MPQRNLSKVQDALNALTSVQRSINELYYYKKNLKKPNHSSSDCSSVRSTIDNLRSNHMAVVNALYQYGTFYAGQEAALANQQQTGGTVKPQEFTYVAAPEHQKSGWESFWEQIILGEFAEETTGAGVVGNIVVSFVAGLFGVDAVMDVRDATANFSKGEWGWGLLDCLFLLPVVGSLKVFKYGDEAADVLKYGDEVIEVFQQGDEVIALVRHGDEIINMGSKVVKNADGTIKATYRIGDQVFDFTNDIFDGVKQVDDLAIDFAGEKLLWSTSTGRQYILSDDTFKVIDKTGEVKHSVSGVKVLPEYSYVKKTEAQCDLLRQQFNNTKRSEFLNDLVEKNYDDLKKLNLTDAQIQDMKNGIVPDGYEVHHKLSLDDGGNNDFENLILIPSEEHKVFTYYQNTFTKTTIFDGQEYMVVDWIIPTGSVYIP